jgi:DNA-binding transcriptional ArsR family regulator
METTPPRRSQQDPVALLHNPLPSTKWLTVSLGSAILNHMVEDLIDMDAVFHALANGARRDMVGRLAGGELTVGQLAAPLTMSLAAASKHVQVLERAGLVHRRVDGRRHLCRLQPAPLESVHRWLGHYEQSWNERLDALEALLRSETRETEQ